MTSKIPPPKQYDTFATTYPTVESLPTSQIESQLIHIALGDCTSLSILDLGGGNGMHARRAIKQANAASVDVVDISKEMLRIGQEIPFSSPEKLRWFEADVSKPLPSNLDLNEKGSYDIVMANWVFDHALSEQDLKGMWKNVSDYLKPGGKFLGVRVRHIKTSYLEKGKYGVRFLDHEEIDDGKGWKYVCECLTEPRFSFGATSMKSSLELDEELPREFGLGGFELVEFGETEVVKGDRGFWEEFLKEPSLVVVTGKKL
ncbi:Ubiquinone/menaquinone biosynthesis C-methyltransferase UbiE [Podospora fimiseda]|uniref:Ubiquinone/menaquinone biosynthesis C-methyltransferase UbiE n=1 Tax=Podospora fimiseda TaxID=252190 RepID=A0AAN7BCP9_9PEZI|nr:Ubiquinone/menaquinone biosynthesis C-methyltransferase UbiE [Podospora fimiseda]